MSSATRTTAEQSVLIIAQCLIDEPLDTEAEIIFITAVDVKLSIIL